MERFQAGLITLETPVRIWLPQPIKDTSSNNNLYLNFGFKEFGVLFYMPQ